MRNNEIMTENEHQGTEFDNFFSNMVERLNMYNHVTYTITEKIMGHSKNNRTAKLDKIGQAKKTLISTFAHSLAVMVKIVFLDGRLSITLPTQF